MKIESTNINKTMTKILYYWVYMQSDSSCVHVEDNYRIILWYMYIKGYGITLRYTSTSMVDRGLATTSTK